MINIDPDVKLPKEKPGQEFRYNFLEDLPPVEVGEIIVQGVEIKPDPDTFLKDVNLKPPLQPKAIRTLQAQDTKIINLLNRLKVGDLDANVYLVKDGIPRCRIVESTGYEFKPIVIPKCLMVHVLVMAQDYSGHNGFSRMYAAVRHLYFWVGMKRDISHHCKRCQICTKHNIAKVKFEKNHFKGARQPMQFISMDLIGEFHPPS